MLLRLATGDTCCSFRSSPAPSFSLAASPSVSLPLLLFFSSFHPFLHPFPACCFSFSPDRVSPSPVPSHRKFLAFSPSCSCAARSGSRELEKGRRSRRGKKAGRWKDLGHRRRVINTVVPRCAALRSRLWIARLPWPRSRPSIRFSN